MATEKLRKARFYTIVGGNPYDKVIAVNGYTDGTLCFYNRSNYTLYRKDWACVLPDVGIGIGTGPTLKRLRETIASSMPHIMSIMKTERNAALVDCGQMVIEALKRKLLDDEDPLPDEDEVPLNTIIGRSHLYEMLNKRD